MTCIQAYKTAELAGRRPQRPDAARRRLQGARRSTRCGWTAPPSRQARMHAARPTETRRGASGRRRLPASRSRRGTRLPQQGSVHARASMWPPTLIHA